PVVPRQDLEHPVERRAQIERAGQRLAGFDERGEAADIARLVRRGGGFRSGGTGGGAHGLRKTKVSIDRIRETRLSAWLMAGVKPGATWLLLDAHVTAEGVQVEIARRAVAAAALELGAHGPVPLLLEDERDVAVHVAAERVGVDRARDAGQRDG